VNCCIGPTQLLEDYLLHVFVMVIAAMSDANTALRHCVRHDEAAFGHLRPRVDSRCVISLGICMILALLEDFLVLSNGSSNCQS